MTNTHEMPFSLEMEQSLLGSILGDNNIMTDVVETITPDDFYRGSNRTTYEAMLKLYQDHQPIDLVTVTEILDKTNKLDLAGGINGVSYLCNVTPFCSNYHAYMKVVKEKSQLRQLINTLRDCAMLAYAQEEDTPTIFDMTEQKILALTTRRDPGGFRDIQHVLASTFEKLNTLYENKGGLNGVSSGFKDMDNILSGFKDGSLYILAARTSMGKSALAGNIATYVSLEEHKNVAIFTMEMSAEEFTARMLSSESGVNGKHLKEGTIGEDQWSMLIEASDRMQEENTIFYADDSDYSVMDIRSRCRRLKAQKGLGMIIIDYLQLMHVPGHRANGDNNRQQEVAEISRGLKNLARELKIPIIALSQLSRAVEARQVKRPMLSDLRESGALEQDADVVMFLYRPSYYETPEDQRLKKEDRNKTQIIIAKNRNGPIGEITLYFQEECTRFRDIPVK